MFQQFPFKTPSIHFGHGAISVLGKEARKLEGQRVLLITGPSIRKAGILDKAPASLPEIGITDRSKIPRWAVEAHAERRLLGRCARNLTVRDIEKIYARAFEPR